MKTLLTILFLVGFAMAADAPKPEPPKPEPKAEPLTLTEVTAIQAVIQQERQILQEVCAAHGIKDVQQCRVDPEGKTIRQIVPPAAQTQAPAKEEPKKP
jgi:hypothetical protein